MDSVDRGRQILVLTIDIGNGRNDFVVVHEFDDPAFLASEFAAKYALDSKVQKNLQVMIQENVKEVMQNALHLREPDGSEDSYQSPLLSPIKHYLAGAEEQKSVKTEGSASKRAKKNPSRAKIEKPSVYGEVYRQLRKTEASKSMSSVSTTSKKGSNYGDYLYAKALKDKEQSEKFKEMKKQEQFEKDMHHYTFSPLINTNSSVISPRAYDKTELFLYKKQQEKQEKIQKLKENQDKETMKECSFVPKINKNSLSRESLGNKHVELYNQAQELKFKRAQSIQNDAKKFSFHPHVGNAQKKNQFESTEEFLERLENSKTVSQAEIEEIRRQRQDFELSECKQFKDSQNSAKISERNNSVEIWDFLYSQRDSKNKEILISQQEFQKSLEAASQSKKISDRSSLIFEKFRQRQFEQMFDMMDSDGDGKISVCSIDINSMDLDVLKVMTPFFEELEQYREGIEKENFVRSMENLYSILNVEQKAVLVKRLKKEKEEDTAKATFLSPRSKDLAGKINSKLPEDFFERQIMVTKMKEMKVEQLKQKIDLKDMSECSFKPIIYSK
jgi:hypothetical protein